MPGSQLISSGRIRIVAGPLRVRRRDAIAGPDHTFGDVLDEREVAFVVAVVEHVDGFALEDVLGEQEQRHVGPAPGTVHREETQAGHG